MHYRPEIDGLRAIAVVSVIFFHAGFNFFSGGFVGVDIFFVISGYLITSIILFEMDNDKFSLANFYERRARRILPALYIVLFVCCIYLVSYQAPFSARDLSQSIFATSLFAQNFLSIFENSQYFEPLTTLKPLFHMWSLSVEEQYYTIFPFLLILTWGLGRRWVLTILAVVFLLSSGLWLWGAHTQPHIVFYLLPSRGWEILLGAFVAFYLYRKTNSSDTSPVNQLASLLGLSLIFYAVFAFDQQSLSQSWNLFIPTLGTALLISYSNKGTITYHILSNWIFVGIGLISYSAYLWHQPILSILRAESTHLNDIEIAFITIIFSGLLSYTSYRFVETPIRKGFLKTRNFCMVFTMLTAMLLGISWTGHKSFGYELMKLERIDKKKQNLYISHFTEVYRRAEAKEKYLSTQGNLPSSERKVIVIGDSMSEDLAMALNLNDVSSHHLKFELICIDKFLENGIACEISQRWLLDQVSKANLIILAFNFDEKSAPSAIKLQNFFTNRDIDTKILGVLSFKHVSNSSYQYIRSDAEVDGLSKFLYTTLDPNIRETNSILSKNSIKNTFIDKFGLFCDANNETCDLYNDKKNPLYFDWKHLTIEGLEYLGARLLNSIFQ